MKKLFLNVVATLLLVLALSMSHCEQSFAYTEEEKQQAKAWLSAHGYSPDMGGANQAYQDYLNGKFDEELGQDINGDGIPATESTSETTETIDTQSNSQETTTEESSQHTKENDADIEKSSEQDGKADQKSEAYNPNEVGKTETEQVLENAQSDEQTEDETDKESVQDDIQQLAEEEGEVVNTEEDAQSSYSEAIIVIIVSVMCMCAVAVLFSLRRTKG